MTSRQVPYGSSARLVRQVTHDLAIELWVGDGPHTRLVADSYPVKVALADLGALTEALKGAIEALAEAADQTLDHTGPVVDQEGADCGPGPR